MSIAHVALPLLVLLAGASGCGTDSAISQARSTLVSATRVVTDLDTSASLGPAAFGPEVAAHVAEPPRASRWEGFRRALVDAGQRVEEASVALDLWEEGDSGSFAWTTVVPCLAQALAEIRGHLEALGVTITVALDEALALTSSSGERCGSRRPPAER